MINETVILLAQLQDCSGHRLAKHFGSRLVVDIYLDTTYHKPLYKIFSKVIPYDFTRRMTEIGVKGVNEEIIELVRQERPKYVLWLSAKYEFRESTFDSIREEGSIVVGWFSDDEYRFNDYSKWWIPHLDYCVTFDIEAVPKYRALGARVIQPISCIGIPVNVNWSNIKEKYDVSFVGSILKPLRKHYISELRKRNVPVHLFGSAWDRYVPFEEMIDIFGASKINLNFSRASRGDRMGIKGRVTGVCLAGGFLLTEYVPGIENYFEIDKEIVCFENTDEMIDKITYYLNHDEERRAIAQAGWKRATSEYTPFHMLSGVFNKIERDIVIRGKPSHPQKSSMPKQMRKRFSTYYSNWARAFSLGNYRSLCKDAFALSISYNPFNIWAWCYYIASFLPYPVRLVAYTFGRLVYHTFRHLHRFTSSILRVGQTIKVKISRKRQDA